MFLNHLLWDPEWILIILSRFKIEKIIGDQI